MRVLRCLSCNAISINNSLCLPQSFLPMHPPHGLIYTQLAFPCVSPIQLLPLGWQQTSLGIFHANELPIIADVPVVKSPPFLMKTQSINHSPHYVLAANRLLALFVRQAKADLLLAVRWHLLAYQPTRQSGDGDHVAIAFLAMRLSPANRPSFSQKPPEQLGHFENPHNQKLTRTHKKSHLPPSSLNKTG